MFTQQHDYATAYQYIHTHSSHFQHIQFIMDPQQLADLQRLTEVAARREREARIAQLTLDQLSTMSDDTRVYRTMGRAFLLGDMAAVRERLAGVAESSGAEAAEASKRAAELREALQAAAQKAQSAA